MLGLGLGIALIIEGLMPFAAPAKWRQVVQQIQQLQDGQLRYFGLISIGVGLGIVLLLMP
ncbi:MAG: hypothetical protein RLZZ126_1422 [Pseudomonadota bacterium]